MFFFCKASRQCITTALSSGNYGRNKCKNDLTVYFTVITSAAQGPYLEYYELNINKDKSIKKKEQK
jgi:hypothetical protein